MLAAAPAVVKLDLSETNSPGVTDAASEQFAKMKKIKDLNFWSTQVGDDLVEKLAGLKTLTRLNLDKTNITNASIKQLTKMPQLTWLHIGSNAPINDDAIEDLLKLPNLKYLNITGCKISDEGFLQLDDALSPKGCIVIGP